MRARFLHQRWGGLDQPVQGKIILHSSGRRPGQQARGGVGAAQTIEKMHGSSNRNPLHGHHVIVYW